MTAKEYLSQTYRMSEAINSDSKELEYLKALCNCASNPDTISGIAKLECEINEEIIRYVKLVADIRDGINAVSNADERLLLQKRYLLFQTWQEIAEDMNFSIQWVRKLHKRALHSFSVANNFI